MSVEGELWKLKEDQPAAAAAAGPRRARRIVLVGIIGLLLLLCTGAGALVARGKISLKGTPPKPPHRGLNLVDRKLLFSTGIIQTVDIRIPCSGLLTIDVKFPKGSCLNVFLVSPEERVKMDARQTFRHVHGFDAKTTSGNYQRTAELPPGRYCMVILDESGSRSIVEVKAHLGNLK
jgi:hypothetical protein